MNEQVENILISLNLAIQDDTDPVSLAESAISSRGIGRIERAAASLEWVTA